MTENRIPLTLEETIILVDLMADCKSGDLQEIIALIEKMKFNNKKGK
jgi:hypothetical protein